MNYNFNPTLHCPYCNGVNRPSISGWGREGLNIRHHICKHCLEAYSAVIYAEASKGVELTDGSISSIKSKIKYLKQRTKEIKGDLTNTHAEWAEEFIRTAASTRGMQN